jgi:hypothetical protein
VIVLVPVMMVAASAAGAVLVMMGMIMVVVVVIMPMLVRMIVAVGMIVVMAVRMRMVVAVRVVMMMPMVVIAHMGAALRLERALHRGHGAALTARQLREGRVVLDIERIARHLSEAMVAAEVPGEAREAQRVLSLHLQQGLRLGLHLHEMPVLEPQGVAVVDGGLHVEIEMDLGSALAFERAMAAVSRRVVEGDGVDDAVGLHGGLADDGGDAGHGLVSVCDRVRLR